MEKFQEASAKVATPGQSGNAEDLGGEDGKSKELKLKSNATAKGKAKPGSKESSATPVKDPSAKQEKMYDGEEVEVEEVQEPKPNTKLGMIKQIQDRVTSMKKAEVEEVLTTFKAKEEEELKSKKQEEEDGDEEEVTNEGELPPALKKANDAKKKDSDDDEEEVKVKKDPKAEKITAEDLKLDISTDASALFEKADVDLSEEFKKDAMVIFEAAVATRVVDLVNGKIDELNEDFNVALEEEKAEIDTKLSEKIDDYLTYVSEEWMKENELAVERGIRTEIAEDFITGLKDLFKEHYIDVPEEKYNVLDDLTSQVKELESKLNEQIEKNVNLSKDASELTRASLVVSVSEDLADTEKEKFVSMAENVEFDSADKFAEKLETIKESYFPKTKIEEATSADEVDSVATNLPVNTGTSDAMAAYTAAITKNLTSLK